MSEPEQRDEFLEKTVVALRAARDTASRMEGRMEHFAEQVLELSQSVEELTKALERSRDRVRLLEATLEEHKIQEPPHVT